MPTLDERIRELENRQARNGEVLDNLRKQLDKLECSLAGMEGTVETYYSHTGHVTEETQRKLWDLYHHLDDIVGVRTPLMDRRMKQ